MIGPEVAEKNRIDAVRSQAGAFVKPCGQRGCWQAGIDQNVAVAGPDESCGGMSGSQILRLIPQTIAAERADADDVKTDCGHQAHCVPMTGNVNCQWLDK